MNTSYFVSDVHFRSKDGIPEKMFLAFLGEIEGQADSLFLVGDIFDFWVGHRRLAPDYLPLLNAIERLIKTGTKVHYFTGNHDPAAPMALVEMGVTIHQAGQSICAGGYRLWVEHGDLIDPSSQLRRTICSLARSKLIHRLARLVPLGLAWQLSGAYTQVHGPYDKPLHPDLTNEWLAEKAAQQYDGVILGHYHRAVIHRRRIDGRSSTLMALGDWVQQMTYGRFNDGLELHRYRKGRLNLHPLPSGDHCPPAP